MPELKVKWVVANGIGHYELSMGPYTLSCDDSRQDYEETVKELEQMNMSELKSPISFPHDFSTKAA